MIYLPYFFLFVLPQIYAIPNDRRRYHRHFRGSNPPKLWIHFAAIDMDQLGVLRPVGRMTWFSQGNTDASLKQARDDADAQYRKLSLPSADPRYAFDSGTAEVISSKETYEQTQGGFIVRYCVTRYARNAYGEYFMIMSGASPYFKHVPHNIAKVVLKKQYRAPPSA